MPSWPAGMCSVPNPPGWGSVPSYVGGQLHLLPFALCLPGSLRHRRARGAPVSIRRISSVGGAAQRCQTSRSQDDHITAGAVGEMPAGAGWGPKQRGLRGRGVAGTDLTGPQHGAPVQDFLCCGTQDMHASACASIPSPVQ